MKFHWRWNAYSKPECALTLRFGKRFLRLFYIRYSTVLHRWIIDRPFQVYA